jgi:3-hydroxyacyl-[acyl-carrier-protein] dehydratase
MRFVLVDRLVTVVRGQRAEAVTSFPPDAPLFLDHFPGRPIVPGVLITEALGQTAGWLIAATLDFARFPLLVLVEHMKFRHTVSPGATIALAARVIEQAGDTWRMAVTASVDGRRVADGTLAFQTFPPAGDAAAFDTWRIETFTRLHGPDALREPS